MGAAVLAWAKAIGKGDEVWFVVNGRDPVLPDATTAPGLFWSFHSARSVSLVAVENFAVAADVARAGFERIRRSASGLPFATDRVSFNFVAPDRNHLGEQRSTLLMSRDLFHFKRQVRARCRADGSIAIELDVCASIPEREGREQIALLERILCGLGGETVNDDES